LSDEDWWDLRMSVYTGYHASRSGGPLTIVELDGAAIAAAARRSERYWPEADVRSDPRPKAPRYSGARN
jgi:hypothetical protein